VARAIQRRTRDRGKRTGRRAFPTPERAAAD
jgi:hypothetical protein